jgi:hypothetical protein
MRQHLQQQRVEVILKDRKLTFRCRLATRTKGRNRAFHRFARTDWRCLAGLQALQVLYLRPLNIAQSNGFFQVALEHGHCTSGQHAQFN